MPKGCDLDTGPSFNGFFFLMDYHTVVVTNKYFKSHITSHRLLITLGCDIVLIKGRLPKFKVIERKGLELVSKL